MKFYVSASGGALAYAANALQEKGCQFATEPDTSVTHLLLNVPSFSDDGTLRDGGNIEPLLDGLSENIKIFGGNIQYPALREYTTVDLLQDPVYVAENARITAHCAVQLAMEKLPVTLYDQPVLVVGWGRIGKCLAQLLCALGARVAVAARKESDRAILTALGYDTVNPQTQGYELVRYRVIFNTAPEMVFDRSALQYCAPDCLKIDLASRPGLEGDDVVWARGLPGKMAPQSAGELIAKTVLRLR